RDGCPPAAAGPPALPGSALVVLHFDELFRAFAAFFDQAVQVLFAAFQHGVGDALGVQRDGLGGVIVAGNDVVDAFRRVVGVDHGHDRDAQGAGFGDGDLVVAHVDDEQRVGQAVHVLDAADGLVQLVQFALEQQAFLLDHALGAAVGDDRFHVLQALDRGLDRLEVGQHAAQPAGVDVRHAAAGGLGGDQLTGGALGADEQNVAAAGGQLLHELGGVLVLGHRLLEVDDVDLVAMAEDIGGHLGVPVAGLVTEVDASFQHFAHEGHEFLRGLVLALRLYRPYGTAGTL